MDAMNYYFLGPHKTQVSYGAGCGPKPKKKCPFGTSLKCYSGFGTGKFWACVGPMGKIAWKAPETQRYGATNAWTTGTSGYYIIQKYTPGGVDEKGWYRGEGWVILVEFDESSPESAYDFYNAWLQQNASSIGGARTRLITGGAAGWKGIPTKIWADSAEGNTFKGNITSPGVTTETTTGPNLYLILGGLGAVAVAAVVGYVLYKKMK